MMFFRNQRRPVRLQSRVPRLERKAGTRLSRTIETMLQILVLRSLFLMQIIDGSGYGE